MGLISGYSTMTPGIELAENYYGWVYGAMRPYIGKKVLEIGIGYGSIAKFIAAEGIEYRGVDSDITVVENLKAKFEKYPNVKIYPAGNFPEAPEFADRSFDTIISMNVIEHVEDDGAHIKNALNAMKKGRLILFAPAMKALYGSMDRQAGHLRRYSMQRVREIAGQNSLGILKLSYFNSVGALGWFATNRLLKMSLSGGSTGRLALFYDKAVVPFAKLADPLLNRFFGQSIICIAEKK